MTLEIFRALTPFITLALVFGMGMVSWLIKRLIGENVLHFHDLKKELKDKIEQKSRIFEKRIDKVEQEIEKLESSRHVDQRYLYERFVSKENFYLSFEKTNDRSTRFSNKSTNWAEWSTRSLAPTNNNGL